MQKSLWMLAALLLAGIILWSACQRPSGSAATGVPAAPDAAHAQLHYRHDIVAFDTALLRLRRAVAAGQGAAAQRRAFLQARLAYKQLEFLAEYYSPSLAKLLNGPPLLEVAEYDQTQRRVPPEGLQVLEADFYPTLYPAGQRQRVLDQLDMMRSTVRSLGRAAETMRLTDAHLFDAARLQVFRMLTLGLSGFDTPASPGAPAEAAASLRALHTALRPYAERLQTHNPAVARRLQQRFGAARRYLRQHAAADSLDRLIFLTDYGNPLARELWAAQRTLQIPFFQEARALRPDAATLFDLGAFDAAYFAPVPGQQASAEEVALGRRLFFDPVLSGNGRRSCASCHRPERAFTDGMAKSAALSGGTVARNAPTLVNAALQRTQFYDGRVMYLEDQAAAVITNPQELHGSLAAASRALQANANYRAAFRRAYPDAARQGIGEQHVKAALASYVRSLTRLNAPFDRYVRGERTALSAAARRGFNVFMGKGKCGTCHFMPLFNGTVPPGFERSETEVLGVPAQASLHPRRLDADPGKQRVFGIEWQRHAFKTPTVRNAALTAPYMHNGAYRTLEEVIEFYERGGGAGLGLDVPNQTLPFDKLTLSARDKHDLVAFLHALTDTTGLHHERPVRSEPARAPSPQFSKPAVYAQR